MLAFQLIYLNSGMCGKFLHFYIVPWWIYHHGEEDEEARKITNQDIKFYKASKGWFFKTGF